MPEKEKQTQVVVRMKPQLGRRIAMAAAKKGLSKAAWVRQVLIEKLEQKTPGDA